MAFQKPPRMSLDSNTIMVEMGNLFSITNIGMAQEVALSVLIGSVKARPQTLSLWVGTG